MQFRSEAQQRCYEKVSPWMAEIFGEFAVPRDDVPAFNVFYGSSRTSVLVLPWGENDALITSIAWLVVDVNVTPDLMQYLLQENVNLRFGAFGISERGDICFRYTIAGSTCTKEELRTATRAVVITADRFDDDVAERWGGRRAIDLSS